MWKYARVRYWAKALTLFKIFKNYNLTNRDLDKADDLSGKLDRYKDDFRILVGMARDTFAGRYKMSKWNLAIIVGAIAYVISPFDAIPDLIPVVGWIDDITIIGYALSKLKDEVTKYLSWSTIQNELNVYE